MKKPFYMTLLENDYNRMARAAKKYDIPKSKVIQIALKELFKTKTLDQLFK